MKKITRILAVLLVIAMVAAVVACAKPTTPSATPEKPATVEEPKTDTPAEGTEPTMEGQEKLELQWSSIPPPASADTAAVVGYTDLIREATGGIIDITNFPGGQLGNDQAAFEGMLSGTIDMSNVSPSVVATVVPEINAIALPFVWNNMEAATNGISNPEFRDKMNEILEPHGIHYLGACYVACRTLASAKEFRVPSEAKGLVIRTLPGTVYTDMYASWGLNSTVIAFGECYTAAQQGVIDGIDSANETNISMAFFEVCKYAIQTKHTFHFQMSLISTDLWNSMTEGTRQIITNCFDEGMQKYVVGVSCQDDKDNYAKVTQEPYNMVMIDLTPAERQQWIDASQKVYDQYKPIIGEDFFNWYMDYTAKYNAQFPD